jgi:asparagine synthase (glutamine-hydrolysing)
MCGILGSWGPPVDPGAFQRGLDRLRHRGPDAEGIEVHHIPSGQVYLGFRRLAIQDLDPRANQPMASACGRYRIVYNGEIYNARALRHRLEQGGARFRTTSDTEVLLAGWIRWGRDVLPMLEGMFAFGVVDLETGGLFLARDPLGIKPLYLWAPGAGVSEGAGAAGVSSARPSHPRVAFASELKALLPLLPARPTLDHEAALRFFTFLWVPEPGTLVEGIRSLPPGGWLEADETGVREGRWWTLPLGVEPDSQASGLPRTLEEAGEAFHARLAESVQAQTVGDVPVGAFLSGGVDSSLIVALLRGGGAGLRGAGARSAGARSTGVGGAGVRTHTAVFPSEARHWQIEEDDAPWAAEVQRLFPDLDARTHVLDPALGHRLPAITWHLDNPVADPAALVTWLISEAAKPSTTVLLSGMGAEELLAGYPRHRAALLAAHWRRIPSLLRRGVLHPLLESLPGGRPGRFLGPLRGARKFARGASLPFEDGVLSFSSYYAERELDDLVMGGAGGADPWGAHRALLAESRGADPVRRMTHLDLQTFLPGLNLAYSDRAGMAASVEIRVPFLDRGLVEWTRTLPSHFLLQGKASKRVLKAAAERELPHALVHRKKAGFQAPVRGWVREGPLRPMIDELLSPDRVRARGVLNPDAVAAIVRESDAGQADHALRIWAFLTFELWASTFLDTDGSTPLTWG